MARVARMVARTVSRRIDMPPPRPACFFRRVTPPFRLSPSLESPAVRRHGDTATRRHDTAFTKPRCYTAHYGQRTPSAPPSAPPSTLSRPLGLCLPVNKTRPVGSTAFACLARVPRSARGREGTGLCASDMLGTLGPSTLLAPCAPCNGIVRPQSHSQGPETRGQTRTGKAGEPGATSRPVHCLNDSR